MKIFAELTFKPYQENKSFNASNICQNKFPEAMPNSFVDRTVDMLCNI
jgi:hypothetical protein